MPILPSPFVSGRRNDNGLRACRANGCPLSPYTSVFSFFVYSFFDAELQWKTDNLCGLISVMLRDRPCQASAWLRPLPCLTKIILANLCLLPIAIQHPARERERMDPPEAPYGKSERQRTIHTAAKKRITLSGYPQITYS